jgi:Tfp pilus assembly protein PilN
MIKVNLLSPEKKEIGGAGAEAGGFQDEERENKLSPTAGIAAGVLTLGVIAFLYFSQAATIAEKERLLEERRARKAELDIVLKTLEELEKAKKDLDRKVKLISELKSRQKDAVKMMDQLSNALPDWVWVQSINFSGKLLNITGKAIHNNLISDFINNLKGTGSFDNIAFPGSIRQAKGGLDVFNFRITCNYKDKDKAAKKKTAAKRKK